MGVFCGPPGCEKTSVIKELRKWGVGRRVGGGGYWMISGGMRGRWGH